MTKREKITISISAILGFAAFCIALVPVCFLIGYFFGDHTCFTGVEYEKLPYAMGEDYVYVPLDFFAEYDFELTDSVSIMYTGKWGQYKNSNFDTPISNTWEYNIGLEKHCSDGYFSNIFIGCSRINRNYFDESSYDRTYGKYKYNVDSQIEGDGEGNCLYYLDYNVCVAAESGSICNFSVNFRGLEYSASRQKTQSKTALNITGSLRVCLIIWWGIRILLSSDYDISRLD